MGGRSAGWQDVWGGFTMNFGVFVCVCVWGGGCCTETIKGLPKTMKGLGRRERNERGEVKLRRGRVSVTVGVRGVGVK